MLLAERTKFFICLGTGALLAPFFLLRGVYRRSRLQKRAPRKILVVPIMTRVGDLVCSTPVFRAIKNTYPNVHLSVIASKSNKGIIENNSRIDTIISMNEAPFKGYKGRLRFLFEIGRGDYDWVICLTNNPFNNLISLFSSAPYRVKMIAEERSMAELCTDWVNTHTILYKNHTSLPLFYLSLLEPLGIKTNEVVKEVFPTEEGRVKVKEFFSRYGAQKVVGISITAGNKIKEWGDEKWAELIRRMRSADPEAKIAIIGSKADAPRIDALVHTVGDSGVFPATSFSLEELPAFVEALALFVGVDTGTIYIAHALGVPLVDIIGPVDPTEQPPSDEKSIQVLPGPGIAPSSFVIKRPGKPEEHKRALDATTVDMVFSAIQKLLSQ